MRQAAKWVTGILLAGALSQALAAGTLENVKARGKVKCGVNGEAPGLSLKDAAGHWSGIDVDFCRAVAAATLGAKDKVEFVPLTVADALGALAKGQVDLQEGLAVDRLRLGLASGTLDLKGRLLPALDLEASLVKLPLDRVAALVGRPVATGLLEAQIKLKGPLDAPAGSLSLKATSLRLTGDNGFGLPAAGLEASLTLKPGANSLDASAQMGPKGNLRLRGQIGGTLPLAPGTLAMKAEGRLDLGLLDPLLTADGRQATGQANLDATIAGTAATPKLDGRLRLAGVSFRDWNSGLNLTHIAGNLNLDGDRLRLEGLSGQAGSGTLTLSGDIGLLAPGLPLNLSLVARNAEPIRFDWLKLKGDADLSLKGPAAGATLAGKIHFDRIDIRLPDRLAASVPTLKVREEGVSRQPRALPPQQNATPAVPFQMDLDLSLAAPRNVYIRGQGVDAELGGELQVGGNLDQPAITGGFNLIRGEYVLVGQTLRFSRGRIGLDGAAGLDPTLDLEARVTAAGSTAILGIKGTATAPRIVLSGEPELPQDEILSRLLFGVAGTRLSTWQTAQVGLAAARLAGLGPKGPGLLESARTALGLDRLSVGTDKEGGTTAEAGRQLVQGDGGCVRGQDRIRRADFFQPLQDGPLDGRVLKHRLDHQTHLRHLLPAAGGGQQRRVRADGFVEREDMELGAEDVFVVHRDEFKFQFSRSPLDVLLEVAGRGGHEQPLASLDLLSIQDGREQTLGGMWLQRNRQVEKTRAVLGRLGVDIDVNRVAAAGRAMMNSVARQIGLRVRVPGEGDIGGQGIGGQGTDDDENGNFET